MSCFSAVGDFIAVGRAYHIDLYNTRNDTHIIQALPSLPTGPSTGDFIADICLSSNGALLAVLTNPGKRLIVYEISNLDTTQVFTLPRAASKIRFTPDSTQILVADKTGDALLYDIKDPNSGIKLFGHLSLLLDILMTDDNNFVVTSDRDEKIRVSHYPNTYNIKSYCLGHKEFVKHIEILPNDSRYMLSASGDGSVKIWDYADGRLCHTIVTQENVKDKEQITSFIEFMDKEEIEVTSLPIVQMTCVQMDSASSLIAVALHNYKIILIYCVSITNTQFHHKLQHELPLNKFPSSMQFNKNDLLVCLDGEETVIKVYKVPFKNSVEELVATKTYKMFPGHGIVSPNIKNEISLLYKRKFDNVQEYQDRKRQRLEKHGES